MKNKKILIIEDDVALLNALKESFLNENYNVIIAQNGLIGLESATTNQPDLILLDIVMPVMDGITTLKEIRNSGEWGKHVPIIILTNLNIDDRMMKNITSDEPAFYLVKTDWALSDVVKKVKEALDK